MYYHQFLQYPVPFGVAVIFPFAPSVIVIVPEFVPELVSKIKSYAPADVIVDAADPVPTTISPDPFGAKVNLRLNHHLLQLLLDHHL